MIRKALKLLVLHSLFLSVENIQIDFTKCSNKISASFLVACYGDRVDRKVVPKHVKCADKFWH